MLLPKCNIKMLFSIHGIDDRKSLSNECHLMFQFLFFSILQVSDDSFTHIFDLSLDSEDSLSSSRHGSSYGKNMSSNSSSPMSLRRDFSSSPSTPSSASSLPLEAAFSQFAASFSSLLADKESAASAALSLDKKISELERLRNKINNQDSLSSASSTTSSSASTTNSKVNTSRYKTELCRPFSEHGTCKYGEKCQFAHGQSELRTVTRHPKYKTDLCRTYHSVGFCPYGPRCHFIHNMEEATGQPQNQQQQQQPTQNQVQIQQQPSVVSTAKKPVGSGRIVSSLNKIEHVDQQHQQIKPLPMFENSRNNFNGWNPLNSNSLFAAEQQKGGSAQSRLPVFSTFSK